MTAFLSVLPFLSFLGLAVGLARVTGLPVSYSPLATATGLIVLLYSMAALGCVNEAITTLQSLGLMILAGLPLFFWRHREWSLSVDLGTAARTLSAGLGSAPPAFVLFLIFGCGAWIITGEARFSLSDEFSHWGPAVKQLLLTDHLPLADSPLLFRAYPPGATLFDAFFLVGSRFRENGVLFAQCLFFLCFVSAVLAPLSWRRPLALGLTVGLMVALIETFTPQSAGLMSAYVDHLIGGLAGAAMVVHFSLRSRWRFVWVTALCLFTLPLIKDAGLFLALAIATACGVSGLAEVMALRPPAMVARKRLLLIALLVVAPLAGSQSWNLWLTGHHLTRMMDLHGSVAETLDGLLDRDRATPQQKQAMDSMGQALLGTLPGGLEKPLPVLVYALGALAALIAAMVTSRNRDRRDAAILTVVLVPAVLIFVIGLLRLYSFTLPFDDARTMTSFERYMAIVLLPLWMAPLAFLLRPVASPWLARSRTGVLLVLCGAGLLTLPASATLVTQTLSDQARSERDRLAHRAAFLLERADHPGRVAVVWHERRDGVAYYTPFLDLLPLRLDPCLTVLTDASQPDIPECHLNRAGWADRLKTDDWVLILRDNLAFRSEMGPLFPAGALGSGLFAFRIDKTGGTIRLDAIDPAAQRRLVAQDEDFFAETLPVLPLASLATDSEDLPSYRQENLFDGQANDPIGRIWSSLPTPMPHFVSLTLKQPVSVPRLVIVNAPENRLQTLDLITGLNGQETVVATLTGIGDRKAITVPLSGAPIDSLRIVVRKNTFRGENSPVAKIGEIMIPGDRIALPDWDTLPVLPLARLETDSEDLPSYPKENLFDGRPDDPDGRAWSSQPTATPHFVALTLKQPVILRHMIIVNRTETRLRALDIVVGRDGQEKILAKLTALGDTKAIDVPLSGVPIDSIRIIVRENSANGADRPTADIAEILFPGYRVSLPDRREP